jgi:hypothetical protein
MITDGNCIQRSEFYGTPYLSEINGSRAVYTDDIDCIAQWKAIFTAGGLEGLTNHVVDTLRQVGRAAGARRAPCKHACNAAHDS